MTRVLFLGFAVLLAACGDKSFESLCANQVPPPAACATACDPAPGSTTSCPDHFFCAANGKCDTQCTATGNECGDGYLCTANGRCQSKGGNGSNNPPEPDASCPAVHFTATPVTPSIQLLIDRSGSMLHNFDDNAPAAGDPIKYDTVETALVGTQGVVAQLESKVYFGATLFSADFPNDNTKPCPTLKLATRALNNLTNIQLLIHNNRPADMARTPTPPSIDAVVADFTTTNKPPAGSPPVIVLATDGIPNQCGSLTETRAESVTAAKNAFAAGVRLFILGVGTIANAQTHLQDMANAGAGVTSGAKAYTATNPTELSAAFQEIIRGVVSCDLTLNGHVDADTAQTGAVTLNGSPLTFNTDWKLDPNGTVIHLLGAACNTLKTSPNPVVDATFACGGAILF